MGLCDIKRIKEENKVLNNKINDYKIKERKNTEKIKKLEKEIKSLNNHCDNLQSEIWELTQKNNILSNNVNNMNNMNFLENQFCMAQYQQMYNNKKNEPSKINIIFKINQNEKYT